MAYRVEEKKTNGKTIYTCRRLRKNGKCKSWFSFFGRIVSNHVVKLIIVAFLFLLVIPTFLSDYFQVDTNNSDYSSIYMLIVNSLLSLTIILYLFTCKTYDIRVNNTIYAFDNQNYTDICSNYYRWVMFRKTDYDKFTKFDKSRYIIKLRYGIFGNEEHRAIIQRKAKKNKEIGKPKGRFLVHFCRILFFTLWMAGAVLLLYYSDTNTRVINHNSRYVFYFLLLASMMLLSYSYYHCILYIAFLHKISCNNNRRRVRDYDYNIYKPSETKGFQQLLSDVNLNTIIFLSIALTFISSIFWLLRLRNDRNSFNILGNHLFFWVVMLYGVFCILSSILVYLVPKIMLRRILTNWIKKSRQILTNELDRYITVRDHSKMMSVEYINAEERISITQERIAGLKNEIAVFRHDSVNIIIALATLLAPLVSVVLSYYFNQVLS